MNSDSIEIVDDEFTIKQLTDMGVDFSLGLIIAPEVTESGEMVYSATTLTLRKLMRLKGIPFVFPHEDQPDVKYLERRSFDWFAPVIVVTSLFATSDPNAISIALSIIASYLTDGLKGFSFSGNVKLSIVVQQTEGQDKRLEYSGSVEGMDKIPSIVETLLLNNEKEND